MSRLTDLSVIFSVASNVLSKSAALRRRTSDEAWRTSSVLRNVGELRKDPSDSHDIFSTDTRHDSEETTNHISMQGCDIRDTPTQTVNMPTTKIRQPADTSGTLAASKYANSSSGEEPTDEDRISHDRSDRHRETDDIFLLRNSRTLPKSSTLGNNIRENRTFRADKEVSRPTQADRFDVRSSNEFLASQRSAAAKSAQTVLDNGRPKSAEELGNSVIQENIQETLRPYIRSREEEPVHAQMPLDSSVTSIPSNPDEVKRDNRSADLSSSAVPSSRMSRLYHYTTLGASLGFNALSDSTKRILNGPTSGSSSGFLSPRNSDLLVKKLSRMRGAALKLGQMISFQDEQLPAPIRDVLQRVQDSADYMPAYQLNAVMNGEFGSNWRGLFSNFDDIPIAAASIGQVHRAVLLDGRQVAVKVQYPGVANSISSDLRNLSLLLTATRLLPKGLYLDKTIENARTELGWECDYIREAENTRKFRTLLGENQKFQVPEVIDECSGKLVLTTEFLHGIGIAKTETYSQDLRNHLGSELMRLCLEELATFKFMQTDPNWTNFLYNSSTKRIELLDFGACRAFDDTFIDRYCRLLVAAARSDRQELEKLSKDLGYLTGAESSTMVDAHISSILTLSEPFSLSSPNVLYDFKDQTITDRVKSYIPVMLRERLAPPPEETYSLHRRLSGHFLLCARLRSQIPCKQIFIDVMTKAGYLQAPE